MRIKRVFAFALAAMICVSSVGVTAWAEEEPIEWADSEVSNDMSDEVVEPPTTEIPRTELTSATPSEMEPPEPQEIVSILNYESLSQGILIPVDGYALWEEQQALLTQSFSHIYGRTADGEGAMLEAESMDFSAVDPMAVGEYTVTAKLKVTEECAEQFFLSEELLTANVPVFIGEPDEFTLYTLMITNRGIHAGTLYALDSELPVSIYFCSSETELEPDELVLSLCTDDDIAQAGGDSALTLSVIRRSMIKNFHYYFRVSQNGVYSDILHLVDDGKIVTSDGIGGDRDGGDTNGNSPPDITQPPPNIGDGNDNGEHTSAPKPPGTGGGNDNDNGEHTPASTPPGTGDGNDSGEKNPPPTTPEDGTKPTTSDTPTLPHTIPAPSPAPSESTQTGEPFFERITETTSTISGARLRMMTEDSGSAMFSKQGASVSLPAELVAAWKLQDDDVFSIELTYKGGVLSLSVQMNGQPVTDINGSVLKLQYTATTTEPQFSLLNEGGETVSTGSYDSEQKVVSFMVNTTGKFTVLEEAVPAAALPETPIADAADKSSNPTLPIALSIVGGMGLFAAGGFLFYRKRRK